MGNTLATLGLAAGGLLFTLGAISPIWHKSPEKQYVSVLRLACFLVGAVLFILAVLPLLGLL